MFSNGFGVIFRPKLAWTRPKLAWTGPKLAWTGPKVELDSTKSGLDRAQGDLDRVQSGPGQVQLSELMQTSRKSVGNQRNSDLSRSLDYLTD